MRDGTLFLSFDGGAGGLERNRKVLHRGSLLKYLCRSNLIVFLMYRQVATIAIVALSAGPSFDGGRSDADRLWRDSSTETCFRYDPENVLKHEAGGMMEVFWKGSITFHFA
jgi:hypothetical protein